MCRLHEKLDLTEDALARRHNVKLRIYETLEKKMLYRGT